MFMLSCGGNPQLVSLFTCFLMKILIDELFGTFVTSLY